MTSETEEQKKRKKLILEAIMGRRPQEGHMSGCQCVLCKGDPKKIQRIVTGISEGQIMTKKDRKEITDIMNEPCEKCSMPRAFCKCPKD